MGRGGYLEDIFPIQDVLGWIAKGNVGTAAQDHEDSEILTRLQIAQLPTVIFVTRHEHNYGFATSLDSILFDLAQLFLDVLLTSVYRYL